MTRALARTSASAGPPRVREVEAGQGVGRRRARVQRFGAAEGFSARRVVSPRGLGVPSPPRVRAPVSRFPGASQLPRVPPLRRRSDVRFLRVGGTAQGPQGKVFPWVGVGRSDYLLRQV